MSLTVGINSYTCTVFELKIQTMNNRLINQSLHSSTWNKQFGAGNIDIIEIQNIGLQGYSSFNVFLFSNSYSNIPKSHLIHSRQTIMCACVYEGSTGPTMTGPPNKVSNPYITV
jgi:hypothetical protein